MASATNPVKAALLHLDSFLIARPEVPARVDTLLGVTTTLTSRVHTLAEQVRQDAGEAAATQTVVSDHSARLATLAAGLHADADHLARLLQVNLERSGSLATLPRTPRLTRLAPELRQFLAGLTALQPVIAAWPVTAEIYAGIQRDFAEYEQLLAGSQAEKATAADQADDVPALLAAEHDFILFVKSVATTVCELDYPELLPEVRLYQRAKVVKPATPPTAETPAPASPAV